MTAIVLKASFDPETGQTYVPPRELVADGSLRRAQPVEVAAQGVLFSATTFHKESYGIVDLDCGARVQTLLMPGTDQIGKRVIAREINDKGQARFGHE
ncbi:MAG TPA: hypothetical protein VIG85_03420 [Comamonas sp.]